MCLVYYDLWFFVPHYPTFYILSGAGRVTRKIHVDYVHI
jgi:hypothetical protein